MALISTFMIGYLLGGLTLFPVLLAIYVYLPTTYLIACLEQSYRRCVKIIYNPASTTTSAGSTAFDDKHNSTTKGTSPLYKVGWLRMTQGKAPTISLKKPSQRPYFAVLKYHTLYLYDSDEQLDCQQVLALQNYKVEMYPPDIQDAELFSRPYWIQLTSLLDDDQPQQLQQQQQQQLEQPSLLADNGSDTDSDSDSYHSSSKTTGPMSTLYLHCHLCTEKEDWYQLLMQASGRPRTPVTMGSLQPLIQRVHCDGDQLELQWFNALLGRLFLGIHQSERFRQSVWTKVMTKVDKINARRPPFLGEIQVRAVDIGGNLPLLTRPRLVNLTPQGECRLEAMVDYQGADLHIEIATVLQWSYSDRLPPLTMDIVLRVTLQSLKGKVNVLIKPPPCNRIWYGFDGLPAMKWHIAPLVWETKVGHSMVVKAIIKHLEEVFRDTMVMPHMDDITFFDADGLGGIYQEEYHDDDDADDDNQQNDDHRDNSNDEQDDGKIYNSDNDDGLLNEKRRRRTTSDQHQHHMGKGLSGTTARHTNGLDKRQAPILSNQKANVTQSPTSLLTSSPLSYHQSLQQKQRQKGRTGKDANKKVADTRKKSKRQSTSVTSDPVPIVASNNKKKQSNGKKTKRQEDMKLLSTARSFPELISAHNNSTTTTAPHATATGAAEVPIQQQQQLQQPILVSSSSTSSTTSSSGSSSQVPGLSISPNTTTNQDPMLPPVHRFSPPDPLPQPGLYFSSSSSSTTTTNTTTTSHTQPLPPPPSNDPYSSSPPALRPRRSFANLGQKTSASTAVSQVNTAAGFFAGKQQQQQHQQQQQQQQQPT
ncbi:putative integral membrane protein conserved region-domain-containing protein [Absidia repens]|uniref:Putative integral membrane protein conserved region-domain-containing protein n=1 Tax=Absidia repens TaxID=90262 RepID=A0A1X2HYU6_9FUNG|nr:putative integral membrane protein conserved region-domain-containing protein [Absidia repens]